MEKVSLKLYEFYNLEAELNGVTNQQTEEVKEVVEKAAAIAPKNETIKKAKEVAKKAPASKSAKKSK